MTKSMLMLAGAAAIALPAIAYADHHGMKGKDAKPMIQTRAEAEAAARAKFAMHDLNRDGAVTREEIAQHRDQMRTKRQAERFDMIDTDKNGQISRAEFTAHHQQMADHAKMGHGGGKMRGMRMNMDDAEVVSDTTTATPAGPERRVRVMMMRRMGDPMMADANKDGRLTEAEVVAAAQARFDRRDADKNGTLSDAERKPGWQRR